MSRRSFLAVVGGASAGLLLASCGRNQEPVLSGDESVAVTEERRRRGAKVHEYSLTAGSLTADLGGLSAATWVYNGTVPGPEIRLPAGDVLRVRFKNDLPQPTTIHWHGIALRNDMDGVPDVTQDPVRPGATFTYEFVAPDPGTYWFHPHFGMHLDRGLYAPLIVEDAREAGSYDREYTVVLDDWIDGIGASPEETLEELRKGGGVHAKHLAAAGGAGTKPTGGPFLGGEGPGDVAYPMNLVNGRRPTDPVVFEAKPGERLRLRIINAGADTPFRVALQGHRLTVTHTDGFPVEPFTVDTLVIGMAERYDVLVTVDGSGVFPLVALAEARGSQAMAVVRSGDGPLPPANVRPVELTGQVLALADLRATDAVDLGPAKPDRTHTVRLGGGDNGYVWTINGKAHAEDHAHGEALKVEMGERVRLVFENRTTMFHPMHLHGHTFQVVGPRGRGARKDTTIVRPDERISVDFLADNPGQWMLHCHNLYHQQGGMMTTISYEK